VQVAVCPASQETRQLRPLPLALHELPPLVELLLAAPELERETSPGLQPAVSARSAATQSFMRTFTIGTGRSAHAAVVPRELRARPTFSFR
jgi:hypothetical protein